MAELTSDGVMSLEVETTTSAQGLDQASNLRLPAPARGVGKLFELAGRGLLILFCMMLMIVLLPLFLLVALLVEINSPGPVFYYGARVGRGSSLYKVVKFRTLPVQYEDMVGDRVLTPKERTNGLLAQLITRTKLDEVPQLINVIKGDMSFVGPRPVRPLIASKYSKEVAGYSKKFAVRPGITGLAQIVGGYYMHPIDKHKYDMLYLRHKSFFLDLKIIFLTFAVLLCGRRIMKWRLVELFLGFKLNVKAEEIDTSKEAFDKVTSSN